MKRDLPNGTHEANRATSRRDRRMGAESEGRGDRGPATWTRSVVRSLGESLEQFDVADTLEELRHHIDDLIRRLAERDDAAERRAAVRQPPPVTDGVEAQIGALGRKVEAASDLLAELTDLLEAQTERIETIEQQLGDPDDAEPSDCEWPAPGTGARVEGDRGRDPRETAALWPSRPLPRPEASAQTLPRRAPLVESVAATLVERVGSSPARSTPEPEATAGPTVPSFRPGLDMDAPDRTVIEGLGALERFLDGRFTRLETQLLRLEERVEEFRALTGERDRQIHDLEERLLILVDGWHRNDDGYGDVITEPPAASTASGASWPPKAAPHSEERQRLHGEDGPSTQRRAGHSLPGPKAHLAPALEVHARGGGGDETPEPESPNGGAAGDQRGRVVAGGKRRGRRSGKAEKEVAEASSAPVTEPSAPKAARQSRVERLREAREIGRADAEPESLPTIAGPARGPSTASSGGPEAGDLDAGGERLRARLNGEAAGEGATVSAVAPAKTPRPVPRPLWRQLQDNTRPFPNRSDAGLAQAAERLRRRAGDERDQPVVRVGSGSGESARKVHGPSRAAAPSATGADRRERGPSATAALAGAPVEQRPAAGRGVSRLEEIVEREVRARRDFPAAGGPSAGDLVRGRKVRPVVMVVDDVPDARTVLSLYLSKTGYHVVTAASAEDCLGKLRHHEVDAIVLDARLPGASGAHVCEVLRDDPAFANCRNVPIIVYTAHPDEYPRELVERWRVAEYVVKGGDMLPLITALVRHTKIAEDHAQ